MTVMKTTFKASLIATAIAMLPFGVQAAGLGSINVFSAIGQPLKAEIQLNATPQELQALAVRIPSADAFRQADLPYSSLMTRLKLAVESRGTRAVVKVSTVQPVSDPFVDMLIELDWSAGRLIREYTFLLDPLPADVAPAAVASPAVAASSPTGAVAQNAAPSSNSSRTDASATSDRYEVRKGDTLHAIAGAHRPRGASLDQMLIGLYRENPDAFDGGNFNRMRAGAILQMPADSAVMALDPEQAHREVVAQAADFNAYRRKLAGTVASRPATGESAPSRAGSGAIVPKVAEPQPQGTGDQVKISASAGTAGQGESADSSRLAQLRSLEEELAARDKALAEANSRLAALEESIREMQQLLELKSQSLGQLPQQTGAGVSAGDSAGEVSAQAPAAGPESSDAQSTQSAMPAPATVPAAPEQPPKPETSVAPKAPEPAVAPAADAAPDETLLSDPKLWAAGLGVLALLLIYAGLRARNRRKAAQDDRDAMGIMSEQPPTTNSVFGATGGQSVNTSDSSVIHTDFSQSGLSSIDADEGVDPVAEADVYMAYGRDAQAEEILLDALKADSSRPAVFLKLLEIYAQRKSIKQFETTASDLYSRTGGEGPDWEKAAEMGRKIDPENPLYDAASHGVPTATHEVADVGATRSSSTADAAFGAAAAAAATAAFGASSAAQPDAASAKNARDATTGADRPDIDATNAMHDAEPAVALPDSSPGTDSAALDFDLDLDAGIGQGDAAADTGVIQGEALQTSGAAERSDDLSDALEFHLDIGDEADSSSGDLMDGTLVGRPEPAALDADMQLDLAATSDEMVPNADTNDFNLSETSLTSDEPSSDKNYSTEDLEKTTFDSSLLDFDFNLEEDDSDASPAAPPLDLSSINLDLEPATADVAPSRTAAVAAVAASELAPASNPPGETRGEDAPEAGGEDLSQEIDTKLELARAYEEMGDKEGARELIDEVLREGSAGQRDAANLLMARLA